MMQISKISVVGGGSWGTALAALLAGKGYPVNMLLRDWELAENINARHENHRYLPGFSLPDNLIAGVNADAALSESNLIVWAIPCQASRTVIRSIRSSLPENPVIISATKGIEEAHLQRMEEVMAEELPQASYGVISGPSFAREVMENMPTAVVLACRNQNLCTSLQDIFSTRYFRTYASQDVTGAELGGAVKNVIAIAAGLIDGLGFGHNTMAALITRGLAEISRLGMAMGADSQTFLGLSGVGDLVLTCTGALSRNRHVGFELGKGRSLSEIVEKMNMVAEGVKTAVGVQELALQKNVDMPITNAVCRVLNGEISPRDAVHLLMTRSLKRE
ncbi:MAG: NAD(P)-dependent glycerol-3-phosphate dehydrogenase [Desulfovibrionaceae bacterium]|nr:NAD(P)-dependent glycerol-3-phosphate dehydrogenase [Desulfovibrionaceae bacterium]